MLRAITFDILWINSKLAGVLVMFGSIALLVLLPWLDTSRVRSGRYRPMFKVWFWILVVDFVMLMWCGSQPPEQPFVIMSQLGTLYWFVFFLVILPLLGILEKPLAPPATIEEDFIAHYGTGAEGMENAAISKPAE
jgi:ubiquinol-cytochrome c reductase cytochrome b subunit